MKKIFFALLVICTIVANAQTEASIRQHYTAVNKQIEDSRKNGYEGSLYQNQLIINKNAKSWPAVGRYDEIIDFWYDDDPNHLSSAERNPKNVLKKVNVSRHTLHMRVNEEYLYKDGKLLFYFSKTEEEGNSWEVRIYYNTKGVSFKTSVKENGKELSAKELATEGLKDFKPNSVQIMKEAKTYQVIFINS